MFGLEVPALEKLSPAAREVLRELTSNNKTATVATVGAVVRARDVYNKGVKDAPLLGKVEIRLADLAVLLQLINAALSGGKRTKAKADKEPSPE